MMTPSLDKQKLFVTSHHLIIDLCFAMLKVDMLPSFHNYPFVEIGMHALLSFYSSAQSKIAHKAMFTLIHFLVRVYSDNSNSWKNTGGNK